MSSDWAEAGGAGRQPTCRQALSAELGCWLLTPCWHPAPPCTAAGLDHQAGRKRLLVQRLKQLDAKVRRLGAGAADAASSRRVSPRGLPPRRAARGAAEEDEAEAAEERLAAAAAAAEDVQRKLAEAQQQWERQQARRQQQLQQVAVRHTGRPPAEHTITARLEGPGGRLLPGAREKPLVVTMHRNSIRHASSCPSTDAPLRAEALTEAAPEALARLLHGCRIGLQVGAVLTGQQAGQPLPEGRELPLTKMGTAKCSPAGGWWCSDRGAGCRDRVVGSHRGNV